MSSESPQWNAQALRRLEWLEREVRALKRGALFGVVMIGVALGAALSGRGGGSGKARAFTLVDSRNQPRATLEIGGDGDPRLTLLDGQTVRARARIGVKDGRLEVTPEAEAVAIPPPLR